jgi:iron complex outermembrane receptor protein
MVVLFCSAAVAENTELPVVTGRVDAVTPPEAASLTRPVEVMLSIVVSEDGSVENPQLLQSAGASFDDAALRAVNSWRFRPASRDGKPVRSRIRVAFGFSPPPPREASATTPAPRVASAVPAGAQQTDAPPPVPNGSPSALPLAAPTEITVQGAAAQRAHGASDFQITVGALRLVPRVLPVTQKGVNLGASRWA